MSVLQRLSLGVVFLVLVLLLWRIEQPVANYLHSWNQVTTLASAQAIYQEPSTWYRPQEVVTRVTWELAAEDRFTIYEEFPLYHLALAAIASSGLSLEVAGRILSIFGFFLAVWSLYQLLPLSIQRLVASLLFLTSFPLLYYGRAIMSDMLMLGLAMSSIVALQGYIRTTRRTSLLLALTLIIMASLSKSYAVCCIIPLSSMLWAHLRSHTTALKAAMLCAAFAIVAVLPVASWHFYAALQEGNQETLSHDLYAKVSVIFSTEFYSSLWKYYFRYLGYLPGVALLVSMLRRVCQTLTRRFGPLMQARTNYSFKPRLAPTTNNVHTLHWLGPWWLAAIFYCIATADKILDHDYYLLLLAPALLTSATFAVLQVTALIRATLGRNAARVFLLLLFLSNSLVSVIKYEKATRSNTDVLNCASLIAAHSKPEDLVASLSDISRFNNLQYYSGRRGLHVEGFAFESARYAKEGARFLVINVPENEFATAKDWLSQSDLAISELGVLQDLRDFKDRARTCALYKIAP